MKYAVLVIRGATGYNALVPDLPGCYATGKTLSQTQRRIASAIEMHVAGLHADRQPVPVPSLGMELIEVSV